MSKIEMKTAVKQWKKVKPLTLTQTGVSEALRPFKTYDPSKIDAQSGKKWMEKFNQLAKVVTVQKKSKHVMKAKKAHAWLKDLGDQVVREGQTIDRKLGAEKERKRRLTKCFKYYHAARIHLKSEVLHQAESVYYSVGRGESPRQSLLRLHLKLGALRDPLDKWIALDPAAKRFRAVVQKLFEQVVSIRRQHDKGEDEIEGLNAALQNAKLMQKLSVLPKALKRLQPQL